jgi:TonB family protein
MAKGKQTCKILKEIRKQIAEENDIELVISECTYQGDCKGTCPKCEAEVRYLERELEKRQRLGKAAVFAGMTIGTAITAASCGPLLPPPDGMLVEPDDTITATTDTVSNDSAVEPFLLEGDVVAPAPDTVKADIGKEKKTLCPSDMLLEIVGGIEDDEVTEGLIVPEVGEVENSDFVDVYAIVEQMPEFPGGEVELFHYISKNIHYPQEAKEKGIQGRVFIGFVIEKDGSVSNVRNLRGVDSELDAEAMRVVESMPKWKPGMHNGEFVRVSYQIPIHFKLEEDQD